jgi:hypothetical protein
MSFPTQFWPASTNLALIANISEEPQFYNAYAFPVFGNL